MSRCAECLPTTLIVYFLYAHLACSTKMKVRSDSTLEPDECKMSLRVVAKILRVLIILQLLLGPLLTANLGAQDHGIPMPTPPMLPATSEENWTVKRFKLDHPTSIYDTWTAKRNKIGGLVRGAIVSGLLKLSVVYKPDIVTITAPMPQFWLNVGDTILRYTYEGEGFADFWIKGRWYKELDGSFLTEQDGN